MCFISTNESLKNVAYNMLLVVEIQIGEFQRITNLHNRNLYVNDQASNISFGVTHSVSDSKSHMAPIMFRY